MLVLDDLHWSDGASVELIASLLRRWTRGSVLLALAFRPGQAPTRLAAALGAPAVTRIALAPLSEAQAGELLAGVDRASVAAMYRHGGGNPFYLEQLSRGLASDLDGRLVGGVADGLVPDGRRGVARGRARRRSPRPRVSCSMRQPWPANRSSPTSPLRSPSWQRRSRWPRLDELLAVDLVRPTSVPRRFSFRHPLVRRAVYETTPGRLASGRARAGSRGARCPGRGAERARPSRRTGGRPGRRARDRAAARGGDGNGTRAPAAAARWFGAVLRLLPSEDHVRQVDVRVALASAQRSLGELERCRSTLLDAIELLPADAAVRRIELTALCAAVEHWLGRHDEAHRRLTRAWEDLPRPRVGRGGPSRSSSRWTGCTSSTSNRHSTMGAGALEIARRLGDGALIAAAASALALGEAASGQSAAAREHRDEALEQIERLSDAALAPRLEALYHLAWAETYLERYDDAIAHTQRGIAIARAFDEGRLLVPMMLVQDYPFEMQGRMAEAIAMCETAVEIARLAANPHYLFWALFELGWTRYYAGELDGATAACEESLRVGGRLTGATMPDGGGGPGWGLAVCRFEAGDPAAMLETMRDLGDDDLGWAIPVERCFDWEILALAELALGRPDGAAAYAAARERDAARLDLQLPAAVAGRTRAAVLLAAGDAAGGRPARGALDRWGTCRRRAAAGRVLSRPRGPGTRRRRRARAAIAVLREAERELDACGSVRARDEVRRELRKLGARSEPRGPAGGESGLTSLTKRELEIADLVTDRLTNREIAGAAVPQRQDDRVARAQHLPQARRLLAGRRRARGRARAARARRRDGHDVSRRRFRRRRGRGAAAPSSATRRSSPAGCVPSTTSRWDSRRSLRSSGCTPSCSSARRGRPGLGVGAAGRARRPVPAARRVRRARVRVPDRGRRLPVDAGACSAAATAGSPAGSRSAPTAVANTTIAYLGAPWALTVARHRGHAQPRS